MNSNFTDRVRKVLSMAREEATRLHHDYVGTEHILLGLIREGEGVAAGTMKRAWSISGCRARNWSLRGSLARQHQCRRGHQGDNYRNSKQRFVHRYAVW